MTGLRAVMAEVLDQWASPRTAQEAADALLAPVREAAIAELRSLGYLVVPASEEGGEVVDDSDQKS